MKQILTDTAGLGTFLWLLGYFASLLLYTTPLQPLMGWILLIVFTPVTVAVAFWWFRWRSLPLEYYVRVGLAWMAIAVVLDYLFIVLLFSATYYGADVFVYYALAFIIPVGTGAYLNREKRPAAQGRGRDL
jgi:hypothetical protein